MTHNRSRLLSTAPETLPEYARHWLLLAALFISIPLAALACLVEFQFGRYSYLIFRPAPCGSAQDDTSAWTRVRFHRSDILLPSSFSGKGKTAPDGHFASWVDGDREIGETTGGLGPVIRESVSKTLSGRFCTAEVDALPVVLYERTTRYGFRVEVWPRQLRRAIHGPILTATSKSDKDEELFRTVVYSLHFDRS